MRINIVYIKVIYLKRTVIKIYRKAKLKRVLLI